jgi:hypothetical protein
VSVQRYRRTSPDTAQQVTGLIRGDSEQPRLEPPRTIKLRSGLVDLQKRLLDQVLSQRGAAGEAGEEPKQLVRVPPDQQLKNVWLPRDVVGQQLLIRGRVHLYSAVH